MTNLLKILHYTFLPFLPLLTIEKRHSILKRNHIN